MNAAVKMKGLSAAPGANSNSPVREYISILRSYLTDAQKETVRVQVEALCLRSGMISPMEYADILQTYLTPYQKAGVVERLESSFVNHSR